MSFPSTEEFIEIDREADNKLIDLVILKGEEDVEDENLRSWTIVSVSEK